MSQGAQLKTIPDVSSTPTTEQRQGSNLDLDNSAGQQIVSESNIEQMLAKMGSQFASPNYVGNGVDVASDSGSSASNLDLWETRLRVLTLAQTLTEISNEEQHPAEPLRLTIARALATKDNDWQGMYRRLFLDISIPDIGEQSTVQKV